MTIKPKVKEVLILCVGSPFAGDSIGMRLGEELQQRKQQSRLPDWMRVVSVDRPGMSMLWEFEKAECIVIIDALVSDHPPGIVMQLPLAEIVPDDLQVSSHECGVAEVLGMARMLELLPHSLHVFGISVGKSADWVPALEQLGHLADTLLEQIALCLDSTSDMTRPVIRTMAEETLE